MPKSANANKAVFGPKDPRTRLQGILTTAGGRAFEDARRELASLVADARGTKPARASDGDTIEYLARGERATLKYLTERGQP